MAATILVVDDESDLVATVEQAVQQRQPKTLRLGSCRHGTVQAVAVA